MKRSDLGPMEMCARADKGERNCTLQFDAVTSWCDYCRATEPENEEPMNDPMSDRAEEVDAMVDMDREHDGKIPNCAVPPSGWYCTRAAGHEGPCAALPKPAAVGLDLHMLRHEVVEAAKKITRASLARTEGLPEHYTAMLSALHYRTQQLLSGEEEHANIVAANPPVENPVLYTAPTTWAGDSTERYQPSERVSEDLAQKLKAITCGRCGFRRSEHICLNYSDGRPGQHSEATLVCPNAVYRKG